MAKVSGTGSISIVSLSKYMLWQNDFLCLSFNNRAVLSHFDLLAEQVR